MFACNYSKLCVGNWTYVTWTYFKVETNNVNLETKFTESKYCISYCVCIKLQGWFFFFRSYQNHHHQTTQIQMRQISLKTVVPNTFQVPVGHQAMMSITRKVGRSKRTIGQWSYAVPRNSLLKGTQSWEFVGLRFWIPHFFIVTYAWISMFCKTFFWLDHYKGRHDCST